MKTIVAITLLSFGLQLQAEPAPPVPALRGIVNLPDLKVALLEITRGRVDELTLGKGQRDGALEVIEIRPEEGKVQVRTIGDGGTTTWLALGPVTNSLSPPGPAIALKDAGFSFLLHLYAECAGRSALQHNLLPRDTRFTLNAQASSRVEACRIIESELAEKQIVTIPDGERFVMVAPKSEVSRVNPHAPKISPTGPSQAQNPTPSQDSSKDEIIPAGMIDLRGADESQVLLIYAELMRKKLDRSERLPWSQGPGIFFVSRTPITREEAIYAIGTLLEWRNVKVVPTTEGMVKGVRLPGANGGH